MFTIGFMQNYEFNMSKKNEILFVIALLFLSAKVKRDILEKAIPAFQSLEVA